MATSEVLLHVIRGCALVAVAFLILQGYHAVRRRSKVLGTLLAVGILARVILGLALFWVSYLRLPIAESLQLGDGFWQLAPDARGYYGMAASGAILDPEAIASATFVRSLRLWMYSVGFSPASALLFNLVMYVGIIVLFVRQYAPVDEWRRDLPCVIGVAAYSLSPALLLHSTQPLKDALTCTLIGLACLAVVQLHPFVYRYRGASQARTTALGVSLMAITLILMGGVRWYYAVVMWFACAAVMIVIPVVDRSRRLSPYLMGSALVLAALAAAVAIGFGSYARQYVFGMFSGGLLTAKSRLQEARAGYVQSAGSTNFGSVERSGGDVSQTLSPSTANPIANSDVGPAAYPVAPNAARPVEPAPSPKVAERQVDKTAQRRGDTDDWRSSQRFLDYFKAVSIGVAFILIPVAVVTNLTGAPMSGGRGLLPVVEIDTLFQGLALACLVAVLWARRHSIRFPLIVFSATLSGATLLLLGYIVTNMGTLWRLRLLAMVPLWFAGLSLSSDSRRSSEQGTEGDQA